MTTLEIILIVAIVYLIIAEVFHFINIACGCFLSDYEDLICDLLWIIMLPVALIKRAIRKRKDGF